jgi:hypothetical protein
MCLPETAPVIELKISLTTLPASFLFIHPSHHTCSYPVFRQVEHSYCSGEKAVVSGQLSVKSKTFNMTYRLAFADH